MYDITANSKLKGGRRWSNQQNEFMKKGLTSPVVRKKSNTQNTHPAPQRFRSSPGIRSAAAAGTIIVHISHAQVRATSLLEQALTADVQSLAFLQETSAAAWMGFHTRPAHDDQMVTISWHIPQHTVVSVWWLWHMPCIRSDQVRSKTQTQQVRCRCLL